MTAKQPNPLEELYAELGPWVEDQLRGTEPAHIPGLKLIRDAVHGYHLLEPHEVAVIDCPLVQRLRYIHQTALAYLVYPTAHHTRFDHSLGVAAAAEKMARALRDVAKAEEVDDGLIRHIRMAGLLHDVGHTFFSHLTESIAKERFNEQYRAILEMTHLNRPRYFQRATFGEILSYVIITSPLMRKFLEGALAANKTPLNLDTVAGLIVGQPPSDDYQFAADIINGPMDADKIDYLLRDCHFTGIKAEVDPERIYYTVDIIRLPDWSAKQYLTIKSGGVPHLEQMLLAKMMLYSSIYHHHKIRALECMTKAAFESLSEPLRVRDKEIAFTKIRDFFEVSEADWFSAGRAHPQIGPLIDDLLNRRLLKRALVVTRPTVHEAHRPNLTRFYDVAEEGPDAIKELRDVIHDSLPAGQRHGGDKLWVDVPGSPEIDVTANHCWVMLGRTPDILSSVFPSDDWMRSHEAHKARAHVFYVEDTAARRSVGHEAKRILRERYDLEFKDIATLWCKMD